MFLFFENFNFVSHNFKYFHKWDRYQNFGKQIPHKQYFQVYQGVWWSFHLLQKSYGCSKFSFIFHKKSLYHYFTYWYQIATISKFRYYIVNIVVNQCWKFQAVISKNQEVMIENVRRGCFKPGTMVWAPINILSTFVSYFLRL